MGVLPWERTISLNNRVGLKLSHVSGSDPFIKHKTNDLPDLYNKGNLKESLGNWYKDEEEEIEKYEEVTRLKSRVELLLNPVAPEEEGKRRLKKIQWILDNIKLRNGTKLVRNANQKAWHKWCIAAVLPKIYGDSWERLAPEVLKEWGKSHILPIYNII